MMENPWVAGGGAAVIIPILIQWAKGSKLFPWISHSTETLNKWASIITAAAAGIAITVAFDFDPESGRFALGMTGNIHDVSHAIGHMVIQWIGQKSVYQVGIKLPERAGQILDTLQQVRHLLAQVQAGRQLRPEEVDAVMKAVTAGDRLEV